MPKRQSDRIAECFVSRAVAWLSQLALTVSPLADVGPVVGEALQPFAFRRRQAAHDHVCYGKVCAVLEVPLLAAACNVSLTVIAEALHLIRQRHLIAARAHPCLQAGSDLAAVADYVTGERHIQRNCWDLIQAARHCAQRWRALRSKADAARLCTRSGLKSRDYIPACTVRYSRSLSGSFFPRRFARANIPAQARALK